ncbi:MAG: Trk system potassium transporter TrkA [Clostridium sp.]|nr:Trk system potassium transporter TrkA [Clostridium sp.]
MRIVIAGAGEVGSHLAKLLSGENQDITVVDLNSEHLDDLDSKYNLMTVVGSPTSFRTLAGAGVGHSDLFIAVTPHETENLLACSIAKSLGAAKTVARVDNYEFMRPEHRDFFCRSGINHLIYPELLAAHEIITALEKSWVRNWFEIHDGELIVVGVKIRENARICGMQLKEFAMERHAFHVAAVKRNHETIIPRGDDRIAANDIVYFATTYGDLDDLRLVCGKEKREIRRVMIMGGSRIAIRLANLAGDRYKIKIIDSDRDLCRTLPEKCPDCRIVYGDARDVDTLAEEGISEMDVFIALSDSSETNILACLTAKELGVRKTIAEVENIHFISEAENLNIGTIVNKKLLASSTIFQILLDADSSSSKFMALADAEVAEIVARAGSKVTTAPVKDLRLPHDMTIAGLIRDNRGMLVGGMTRIQAGDHVVVFCLSGALQKIERLFT